MKSRRLVVSVVIAAIAGLTFGGTTLANHGSGQKRGTFFATLTGHNELSMATMRKNAGDLDGLGSANVLVHDSDTVCFGISVSRISTPTAAHIHRGKRNENGPVRISLTPPSAGNPGASSGCVNGVSSALVSELRRHPNRFYVNVHTSDFPNGAIRGQL